MQSLGGFSGDDVRGEQIGDGSNFVFQAKLLPFQPRDAQHIGTGIAAHYIDGGIKVMMLFLQLIKTCLKFCFIHEWPAPTGENAVASFETDMVGLWEAGGQRQPETVGGFKLVMARFTIFSAALHDDIFETAWLTSDLSCSILDARHDPKEEPYGKSPSRSPERTARTD